MTLKTGALHIYDAGFQMMGEEEWEKITGILFPSSFRGEVSVFLMQFQSGFSLIREIYLIGKLFVCMLTQSFLTG